MKFSDALIQVGDTYWAKQGMTRIYFANLERWYGLVISETTVRGAVVSATLNGDQLDPREARQLRGDLHTTKLWYDPQAAEFVMQGTLSDAQFDFLINQIEERALAVMKKD